MKHHGNKIWRERESHFLYKCMKIKSIILIKFNYTPNCTPNKLKLVNISVSILDYHFHRTSLLETFDE